MFLRGQHERIDLVDLGVLENLIDNHLQVVCPMPFHQFFIHQILIWSVYLVSMRYSLNYLWLHRLVLETFVLPIRVNSSWLLTVNLACGEVFRGHR